MVIGFRVGTCTDAADNADYGADYLLSTSTKLCALLFRNTL